MARRPGSILKSHGRHTCSTLSPCRQPSPSQPRCCSVVPPPGCRLHSSEAAPALSTPGTSALLAVSLLPGPRLVWVRNTRQQMTFFLSPSALPSWATTVLEKRAEISGIFCLESGGQACKCRHIFKHLKRNELVLLLEGGSWVLFSPVGPSCFLAPASGPGGPSI